MDKHYQKQRWIERIIIIATTMAITFLITTIIIVREMPLGRKVKETIIPANKYSLLNEVKAYLDKYYLKTLDEEKMIETANEGYIKGYVKGVGDDYTEFVPKKDAEDYKNAIFGSFAGIGVYLTQDTKSNQIVILAPIEGGPADKAGIKSKDVILKVDDVGYDGKSLDAASEKLKGEIGTEVKVTIKRGEEILEKTIVRDKIKLTHVESKVLEKNIGYVRINAFDLECSKEFKEEVEKLKTENNIKSLIIDVRNNPGGIYDEVIEIADYLLPECEIISTVDKNNNKVVAKSDAESVGLPIIILANNNSASASEILVGAIKDNKAGKFIGTKTYGKGIIQEVYTLSDGSMLKVTTSEYHTPSGAKIQNVGISPDIEVELPEEYKNKVSVPEKSDTQLKKAIEELKK